MAINRIKTTSFPSGPTGWTGPTGPYKDYRLEREEILKSFKEISLDCTCNACDVLHTSIRDAIPGVDIYDYYITSVLNFEALVRYAASDYYNCINHRTEIRALIAASLITDPDFLGPYFK